MKIELIGKPSFFAMGLIAFQSLLGSSVWAEGIPNLNTDAEFRKKVERVLDVQQNLFEYKSDDVTQKYFVGYGKGYMLQHALRLNAFEKTVTRVLNNDNSNTAESLVELREIEDRSKEEDGFSKFQEFLKKAIYQEDELNTDYTKKYSVYLKMPGTEGQLMGPYFSFTLTLTRNSTHELDSKYLDSSTGRIKQPFIAEVARLLIKMEDEEVRKDPELMRVRNGIELALHEREYDLTPEERVELEDTLAKLTGTERMLMATRITPKLTHAAKVEYILQKQPGFSEQLIVAVMNELRL